MRNFKLKLGIHTSNTPPVRVFVCHKLIKRSAGSLQEQKHPCPTTSLAPEVSLSVKLSSLFHFRELCLPFGHLQKDEESWDRPPISPSLLDFCHLSCFSSGRCSWFDCNNDRATVCVLRGKSPRWLLRMFAMSRSPSRVVFY